MDNKHEKLKDNPVIEEEDENGWEEMISVNAKSIWLGIKSPLKKSIIKYLLNDRRGIKKIFVRNWFGNGLTLQININ